MFRPTSSMPPEAPFYSDDTGLIADMLRKEWSLDPYTPTITNEKEALMTDARIGHIHVFQVSRYTSPASCDSLSFKRQSFIGIKFMSRSRDIFFAMGQEIIRIVYEYRRAGPRMLNHYSYIELISDQDDGKGADGWYTGTIDIKLISPCFRALSPGFGPEINKKIREESRCCND